MSGSSYDPDPSYCEKAYLILRHRVHVFSRVSSRTGK